MDLLRTSKLVSLVECAYTTTLFCYFSKFPTLMRIRTILPVIPITPYPSEKLALKPSSFKASSYLQRQSPVLQTASAATDRLQVVMHNYQ